MNTESRIDYWIEHEKIRVQLLKEIEATPLTRNELVEKLKVSRDIVCNLIRHLNSHGYVRKIEGELCSVSKRAIGRYTPTNLKYEPKDFTARKERYEANKAARKNKVASKPKVKPNLNEAVIKVNEYTTIYLNSLRPQSDFAIKKERKNRRNSSVAIGSGMDMFGNW